MTNTQILSRLSARMNDFRDNLFRLSEAFKRNSLQQVALDFLRERLAEGEDSIIRLISIAQDNEEVLARETRDLQDEVQDLKYQVSRSAERVQHAQKELTEEQLKAAYWLFQRGSLTAVQSLNIVRTGNKINSIKEVRTILGYGLLEAKNLVEEMAKEHPGLFPTNIPF